MNDSIVVIGGGPAGLMAAQVLSEHGARVDVYDAMASPGRKFLMAGKGGLNLTHSEPFAQFVKRYGTRRAYIEPMLENFGPDRVRAWALDLGIETFVGTSGRVFPVGIKTSPLLRAWLKRLHDAGVTFHLRHKWRGFADSEQAAGDRALAFETPDGASTIHARAVILALGGGSWARLGSDGAWVNVLRQANIDVHSLKPSNCGFEVAWSEGFRERFQGEPVKSVRLLFQDFQHQGEFIITRYGVQGSLIYAASALLRDALERKGQAVMELDLSPDRTPEWLTKNLSKPRGSRSISNHIAKTIGLRGVKLGLLREFVPKADFANPELLAARVKRLPVPLAAPRPLDEAISSAGGVAFEALDENLMLSELPGVFCAGEMLDWEAPTGGYLLTACFASGRAAAHGVLNWLGVS